MRKIQLTFLMVTVFVLSGYSQVDKLPELEKKIEQLSGEDEIKALHILSEGYLNYEPNKSVLYGEIALKKASSADISNELHTDIINTLAAGYYNAERYNKALDLYQGLLESRSDSTIQENETAAIEFNMAACYKQMGKFAEAEKYYKQSLADAQKVNNTEYLSLNYKALYDLKRKRRRYFEAAEYLEQYVNIKEALFSSSGTNKELILYSQDDLTKKEKYPELSDSEQYTEEKLQDLKAFFQKEIKTQEEKLLAAETALQNARKATDRKVNTLLTLSTIGFFAALIWIAVIYRRKRIARDLLELQKFEIEKQAEMLREKNSKLKESIDYARKIQDSILMPQDELLKYLPEAFIYYQPKDIVSGDFYWFSKVDDELVLAAIDCTGHGIPGAFMSMIGFTLLNEIVNEKRITKPDNILKHLHLGVLAALQQTENTKAADNGMDMSLCTINPRIKRFRFAGAKNHLYVMQGNKLKVLKANHHSVGGRPLRMDAEVEFSSYDFMYDDQTSIYMMSDGYIDQFGGKENRKFNSDRFKEMLMENRSLPMPKQKEIMQQRFDEWRGDKEQVDDILVMGVKL
jgi:serine phosphatase RsbU (regulator of sigma subunit)